MEQTRGAGGRSKATDRFVGERREEINGENARGMAQYGEKGGAQSKEVRIRQRRQTTEQMKTGESSQISDRWRVGSKNAMFGKGTHFTATASERGGACERGREEKDGSRICICHHEKRAANGSRTGAGCGEGLYGETEGD